MKQVIQSHHYHNLMYGLLFPAIVGALLVLLIDAFAKEKLSILFDPQALFAFISVIHFSKEFMLANVQQSRKEYSWQRFFVDVFMIMCVIGAYYKCPKISTASNEWFFLFLFLIFVSFIFQSIIQKYQKINEKSKRLNITDNLLAVIMLILFLANILPFKVLAFSHKIGIVYSVIFIFFIVSPITLWIQRKDFVCDTESKS